MGRSGYVPNQQWLSGLAPVEGQCVGKPGCQTEHNLLREAQATGSRARWGRLDTCVHPGVVPWTLSEGQRGAPAGHLPTWRGWRQGDWRETAGVTLDRKGGDQKQAWRRVARSKMCLVREPGARSPG